MTLWVALAALTTYRLSRMIAMEDGPFDVFSLLRERVGQASWVGRGFHCTLCVSAWLCWPIALLVPVTNWQEYILVALGSAAATVIIHKVIA